ncbi:MAG: TIGR02186 family protein [Nitrospirae bacterium]|nr:TIGR02186 family protein [Nitrospirota bacterium]
MKKFKFLILLSFGFLILNFAFSDEAFAMLTVKENHENIKIDFFYHGSTVSVSGEADSGTDLIIKITSPEGHQSLRKKGKVAGLLWMNVGELKFEHTPNLYFLHSTRNIDEILIEKEMDKYVIGYSALRRHTEINPVANENEKTEWFNEFVKFKESSRLYSTSYGKISTTVENGTLHYYINLNWPYQAPPGDYKVTVYEIEDKKIIEIAEAKVLVEQVSIVKILSYMSKNKGALYGVISIVIALAAGFGVGMIFRKSGGAH